MATQSKRSKATAGTATAFLNELQERLPVHIEAIHVDGGAAFLAGFRAA